MRLLRPGEPITAAQCRAARARLGWSRHRLAVRAGVSAGDVAAFEDGDRGERVGIALGRAFRAAGIGFGDNDALGPLGRHPPVRRRIGERRDSAEY
ncbi:MAG: hypothetical protein ACLQJR_05760 [Stellaceae bacterium]